MNLKHGVRLHKLTPQMVLGNQVVATVFTRFGVPCVITSGNDSKHSQLSKHYEGNALDYRTKYPELDGRETELRDAVKEALGPDFDVVIEAVGTDNEHLHVEYDPE